MRARRITLPTEFSQTIELIDREHGPRTLLVTLAGATVTRQFGPLEGPLQVTTEEHGSARKAAYAVAATLARLRSRGYVEGARDSKLEAAIAREPDDPSGYQVYADWLAAQGDPRGELITVASALDERPAAEELAAREAELFVTHPLSFADPRWRELELLWWSGYVEGLRVQLPLDKWMGPGDTATLPLLPPGSRWHRRGGELAGWLSNLRRHPSGRFVRSVYTDAGVYGANFDAGLDGGAWTLQRTA